MRVQTCGGESRPLKTWIGVIARYYSRKGSRSGSEALDRGGGAGVLACTQRLDLGVGL